MNKTTLLFASFAVAFGIHNGAVAQVWNGELGEESSAPIRIGAELGFSHIEESGLAFVTPNFFGRFRLLGSDTPESGVFDIIASWRLASMIGATNRFGGVNIDSDRLVVGNPFVGARFGFDERNTALHVWFGLTIPLVNMSTAPCTGGLGCDARQATQEDFLLAYSGGLYGAWDSWLTEIDTTTFAAGIDAEHQMEHIFFGGQATTALVFSAGRGNRVVRGTDVRLQAAGFGGWRFNNSVRIGARIQWVGLLNGDPAGAEDLVSFGPFARFDVGNIFVEPRFMVMADIAGVPRPWMLSIALGANF